MKSIIIYFSLTGNTKKVAHAIHNGISQSMERCDIATLKKADISRLVEYDLIVIGSPVWGGVPPNVMRFIDAMPSLKRRHFAVFSTHGASPERFFPPIFEALKNKGLIYVGSNDWYGSVFRPAASTPYLTDGHPDEIDLEEAEEFGREIAELSRKIYEGKTNFTPAPPKMEKGPRTDLNRPLPKLNREKCSYPACSLCMDHCPLGCIDLSVSPPVFARGCGFCYFCEMICPEGAVEADYSGYAEFFRQHAREKFEKVLEEAEKEGTFRRLVPIDKVGWDTPYYMVHNKHPRYVIPEDESD
jgi:flavodoxin/formate hydrogenlyase subunit 6/NADH:ubiquinone oxidoreductase subunit I